MTKRIIYSQPDGTLAVVIPAEQARLLGESEDDFIARIKAKDTPEGVTSYTVNSKDLPADRHFRNAWELDPPNWLVLKFSASCSIDMTKAREIHRTKIRTARTGSLLALDVDYTKADEDGNIALKTSIAAQRRALRDLPQDPAIDLATTPEALKACWPAALPNPYTP